MSAALKLHDIKAWAAPRLTLKPADPLLARAQRLWPDSDRNQREWLRAVGVVRRSKRGCNAKVSSTRTPQSS